MKTLKEHNKEILDACSGRYDFHPNEIACPDCEGEFPVAEKIGKRGFYLPSSSNLTDDEIDIVVNALKEVLQNK